MTLELPTPRSSYFDALHAKQQSATSDPPAERPATPPSRSTQVQEPNSTHSHRSGRETLGGLESDPWGSPDLHRDHAHAQTESSHPVLNGYGSVRSTTNAWANRPGEESSHNEATSSHRANGQTEAGSASSAGFGWGESFGNSSNAGGLGGGPVQAGLGGFGPSNNDQGEANSRRRSLGIGRVASPHLEELITVTLLPEKEGMFMFQHRNYEVKSARRGSTVIRRYSDFVWLLDCLHKRYPFRQLPLLPPKRLSGTSMQRLAQKSLLTFFR